MKLKTWGLAVALLVPLLALPLDSSAQAPPTIRVVDPADPQAFQTIQDAIDASQAGDTVEVAPGTYDESLTILHGLVLQASQGAAVTLSDTSNPGAHGITVLGGHVTISGFVIAYDDGGSGIHVPPPAGIQFSQAPVAGQPSLTLQNLTIRAGAHGIFGMMESLDARDLDITPGTDGVQMKALGDVSMHRIQVADAGGMGIQVDWAAAATLQNVTVMRVGSHGIDVDGEAVTVRDSNVAEAVWGGIVVSAETSALLMWNTVSDTGFAGISGYAPRVEMRNNSVSAAQASGLDGYSDHEGGVVIATGNHVSHSGSEWLDAGIFVDSEKGLAVASHNHVRDSFNGITAWSDVRADVSENTVERIGRIPIDAEWSWVESSAPVLSVWNNTVSESLFGVYLINTLGDNRAWGNRVENVTDDFGIYAASSGKSFLHNNTVRNSSLEAFYVEQGSGVPDPIPELVELRDNVATDVGGGLWAEGVQFVVTNNTFQGAGQRGIDLRIRDGGLEPPVSSLAGNHLSGFAQGLVIFSGSASGPMQVTGNQVNAQEMAVFWEGPAARRDRIAFHDNHLTAVVGFVLDLGTGTEVDLRITFNHLTIQVAFAACNLLDAEVAADLGIQPPRCLHTGLDPAAAPLNYYGPHGPPANSGAYAPIGVEPFLTAPPDPNRVDDNVQTFGFFQHIENGSAVAIGAPVSMARSLHEMFEPDFEGIYYDFDEATQQWVQTMGSETLGPLDARVVVPHTSTRVLFDFADGAVTTQQRAMSPGWNLQAPRQFSGVHDAFDGGAGNATQVAHVFQHAATRADHDGDTYLGFAMETDWLPGGSIDPRSEAPCATMANPLGGYFAWYDDSTVVDTFMPVGMPVEGLDGLPVSLYLVDFSCIFPEGGLA